MCKNFISYLLNGDHCSNALGHHENPKTQTDAFECQ